jgi:large subunit ribosomal protein L9
MSIKVFLKARLEKLGKAGDEVIVKNGYARNFLIPKGFAVVINDSNKKLLARKKQELLEKENKLRDRMLVIDNKMVELNLDFILKVNEKGIPFGSITPTNIISRFTAGGVELTQNDLSITEPLKQLGEHKITIELSPEIKKDFIINILKEE